MATKRPLPSNLILAEQQTCATGGILAASIKSNEPVHTFAYHDAGRGPGCLAWGRGHEVKDGWLARVYHGPLTFSTGRPRDGFFRVEKVVSRFRRTATTQWRPSFDLAPVETIEILAPLALATFTYKATLPLTGRADDTRSGERKQPSQASGKALDAAN